MVARRNNLITQMQLAEIAGVSRAAISKLRNTKLVDAWDGTYMDVTHPAVIEYLSTHQAAPAPPEPVKPHVRGMAARKEKRRKEPPPDTDPLEQLPADIRDLVDLPLRKLLEMFGTDHRFDGWLKANKSIEIIYKTQLDNATKEGRLVNKDLLQKGVIDPVNSMHVRYMQDGCKTLAVRSVAMIQAGRSVEEVEKFMRGQFGKFVKPLKAKIERALQGMKNKNA